MKSQRAVLRLGLLLSHIVFSVVFLGCTAAEPELDANSKHKSKPKGKPRETITMGQELNIDSNSPAEQTKASSQENLSPTTPCMQLLQERQDWAVLAEQHPLNVTLRQQLTSIANPQLSFVPLSDINGIRPTHKFRIYLKDKPLWPNVAIWQRQQNRWLQETHRWLSQLDLLSMADFSLQQDQLESLVRESSDESVDYGRIIDSCAVYYLSDHSLVAVPVWLVNLATGLTGTTFVLADKTGRVLKTLPLQVH